jgi:hypothetical protein
LTPEQRRARGIAAQCLLDDDTIQSGWAEIEADLTAQMLACWLPRKRDRIWNQLRHLKALRAKLGSYASHAPRD